MNSKQIGKNAGRFLGWIGLVVCSFLVRFLPSRALYGFARGLGALSYRLARKQRRIASENLSLAFAGQKSPEGIESIARGCFTCMAKSGVELLFLMDRPEQLKQRVRLVNAERLDRALESGNGVILVSAHFGNFPLMLAKLSLEGYRVGAIMRSMRDARVERIFTEKRRRLRIKTIYSQPRAACVSETIEALRKNEIVFIPIDQNFGTGGVFVEFFGRKAATATGPVVLAQRTKAAVLPCFIIREPGDTHDIVFEEPLQIAYADPGQQTVQENVQRLTSVIEQYVRSHPEQWGWIHRRWKTKAPA